MTMNNQGRPTQAGSGASSAAATFTGHRGLDHEEALIFERRGSATKTGVDLPEPAKVKPPRRPRAQGRDRPARPHRAGGDAPLRAAVAEELLDRHRALSARLVHDEAQPAASTRRWRGCRASATSIRCSRSRRCRARSQLMEMLAGYLLELTGMPAVAMSPKAGAHGELCGMLAIKAAHDGQGLEAIGGAGARSRRMAPIRRRRPSWATR